MFNQKVNHYTQENPSYLNYSYAPPRVSDIDIHNCGTTINKYKKINSCGSLPLQTWCSPNVATESFAMRPIVQSSDYFSNIKKYLQSVILQDSDKLKTSNLSSEKYVLLQDYGMEPASSLLQAINLEATDKLSITMAMGTDKISMFKDFNPICEGFVITDIKIETYRSTINQNHYFHSVVFSAVNTTRYNTITFKANLYQDATPMMNNWTQATFDVVTSQNVPKGINNVNSIVYISTLNLLNDTNCVSGQEDDCSFKGYNLKGQFSQLLNDNLLQNVVDNKWLQPPALGDFLYNSNGNYDTEGHIRISDNGPKDIDKLVKDLSYIYINEWTT